MTKTNDVCQISDCNFMCLPGLGLCSRHLNSAAKLHLGHEQVVQNFVDPNERLKRSLCNWIDEVEERLRKIEKKGF